MPKYLIGLKSELEHNIKKEDIQKYLESLKPTGEDSTEVEGKFQYFHWRYYEISAKEGFHMKDFIADFRESINSNFFKKEY